jgi:hypothetical protein
MYDEYDPASGISSMARTTAYACAAAANYLLSGGTLHNGHNGHTGHTVHTGVLPPETLARDQACFDYVMRYLQQRGINYQQTRLTGSGH